MTREYPMVRILQLIANAIPGDIYYITDEQFHRELLKLDATYGQLKAAQVKRKQM